MITRRSFLSTAVLAVIMAGCCPRPEILEPGMPPQGGTWDKPAAEIGEVPRQSWSETTVEAAVNNQPRDGAVTYVIGEVIDLSCYLQLGKHGAKHKTCAQGCMKSGQPIGLLTREGQVYVLMPEEHHPRRDGQTTLKDTLIDHAADIVKVHGTSARLGHLKALYVTGSVQKSK